ncbi:glycine zipper 2TM domain-containing protein [Sphingomonas sp. UV9]|uniref:glycine zipper 2TM domain-containing protein n=1 Tax=Sphingomonas sp. UV9 TaxID=1851410 RepID=UPI0019D03F64|nr:glycine zipper 2TM domain-containing protein [Sphingomonas sp. UV9]
MKKHLIAALMSVAVAAPAMISTPAAAQNNDYRRAQDDRRDRDDRRDNRRGDQRADRNWRGDNDRNWDPSRSYQNGNYRERRLSRNDRIYRGKDGRAYCKRNDGTTGLVIGALGGGVLANLIGGGTLGTLAGAGGGALLGRSVDRGKVKCR